MCYPESPKVTKQWDFWPSMSELCGIFALKKIGVQLYCVSILEHFLSFRSFLFSSQKFPKKVYVIKLNTQFYFNADTPQSCNIGHPMFCGVFLHINHPGSPLTGMLGFQGPCCTNYFIRS